MDMKEAISPSDFKEAISPSDIISPSDKVMSRFKHISHSSVIDKKIDGYSSISVINEYLSKNLTTILENA